MISSEGGSCLEMVLGNWGCVNWCLVGVLLEAYYGDSLLRVGGEFAGDFVEFLELA